MGLQIPMTEVRAREILGDAIRPDGTLDAPATWGGGMISMERYTLTLNGIFTADELEAIAWWMRNKAGAT